MKTLILCGVLFAIAAPAAAQVRPIEGLTDAFETTVKYTDLDLDSVEGADTILARIKRAARQVCGRSPGLNELAERRRYLDCVAAATVGAVADLDVPAVTARYEKGRAPRAFADMR